VNKTKEIKLRKVDISDASTILKWENNPEFWAITENAGPFQIADILEFIKQSGDLLTNGQQRYMVLDKDDAPIGALDLFGYNELLRSAGVGILIAEVVNRNKGFAHTAICMILSELKKDGAVKQLHCIIHPDNIPSIRLFSGLGFIEIGKEIFKGREVVRYVKEI